MSEAGECFPTTPEDGVRDEEKGHNQLGDWSKKILPVLRAYLIIKYTGFNLQTRTIPKTFEFRSSCHALGRMEYLLFFYSSPICALVPD